METASLIIKVDSTGAKSATADLDKLTDGSKRAERATADLTRAAKVAGTVLGAAMVGATAAFVKLADKAAVLNSRLKLATGSQEAFNKAQADTFRIAQETGSELDSVVNLYARLAQSSGELGLSQAEVAQMTESVTQAFIVSGATAQEASGGIRQLTQALAGGTVRAEEFNSILENSPRIVQALADHFGVSFGKVRTLVNDGKVSSEQFARAMLESAQKIETEYAQMPLTVSRATQEVRNALLGLVGDANEATGATSGLAESVQKLARTLESQEVKDGFNTIVSGVVSVTAEIVQGIGIIGRYIDQYQKLAALRGGADPRDTGDVDALNARLGQVGGALGRLRQGKTADPGEYRLGETDKEMIARLDAERVALIRAITAQIRDDDYAKAFAGGPAEIDFTRGAPEPAKPARASDDIEKRTKAKKELTEAEKAHLEMMQQVTAHDEVATAAGHDYANMLNDRSNAAEEAATRQRQATDDLIEAMEFELSLTGLSNTEREKAIALRLANADAASAEGQKITDLVERLQKARDARGLTDEMTDSARGLFATIVTDSDRASAALDRFFDNLKARMAERLFDGLMAGFGGMGGGGGWAGFASAFAGAFTGGGRAAGGPVMAGQSYLVGEHGPEMFAPGQSGRVHPIGPALAGGGARVKVEVINNGPPVQAEAQTSTAADGTALLRLVINTVADDMAGGGRTAQAMQGRYGLRPAV